MRFLIDANLSPSLATALEAADHDAVHVAGLGLLAASDVEILDRGRADSRVVITADTDFPCCSRSAELLRPRWFSLRHINELATADVAALLTANLPAVKEALERGAIVSLSPTRLAVRELPIRGDD